MDKEYADTVRLLLRVAPSVFANDIFAMKGGTAINLFVRDMPRLSVDIDVVYTRLADSRDEALEAITAELAAIRHRLGTLGLEVREGGGPQESKLFINAGTTQVKVEVNHVFRGAVLPIERKPLVTRTAQMFSVELSLPVLATDELYGSKLVAAMDRQHPRDLFDVHEMYRAAGLTEAAVECFVTYLAGHDRPVHEVLFAKTKDISHEFQTGLDGMTASRVQLDTLLAVRDRLFRELPERLTDHHRQFLLGLVHAEPDWSLLRCPYAADLPALKWKLANLQRLKALNHSKFESQAQMLASKLS